RCSNRYGRIICHCSSWFTKNRQICRSRETVSATILLAVDDGPVCPFPDTANSSKSSTRKRRSPRTPTRKQRKFPLLVQRRNEVSLTCRNSAASAIVRNLCFSSIEMYLPIQTWSYLVLSIHLLPPKVNPSSRDGCVSFFCTHLSWNCRAGRRASEKGFVRGIARAKTTSWLFGGGLSHR